MNRGILATGHVRPTREVSERGDTASSIDEAYADEYFIEVVEAPPATGHVRGSNFVRVFARYDERTGRVTTISVEDNLVKGAAGQAVQAFNIVFGLPEMTGLEQLPHRPVRPLDRLPSHLPQAERVARLPRGFEALGTTAGIKDSGKPDLAVVLVQDGPAAVAATFTTNRLPAAAVQMNRAPPRGHGTGGRGPLRLGRRHDVHRGLRQRCHR